MRPDFILGSLSAFSFTFKIKQEYFVRVIPYKTKQEMTPSVTDSKKKLVYFFSVLDIISHNNCVVIFCFWLYSSS